MEGPNVVAEEGGGGQAGNEIPRDSNNRTATGPAPQDSLDSGTTASGSSGREAGAAYGRRYGCGRAERDDKIRVEVDVAEEKEGRLNRFCLPFHLGGSINSDLPGSSSKDVNKPVELVSRVAHAKITRWKAFNLAWLLIVTILIPTAVVLVWFVAIPIQGQNLKCTMFTPADVGARRFNELAGDGCSREFVRVCEEGDFGDKAWWAFVVNPGTYVFFQYMLISIFLACLDEKRPWRPFLSYAPILLVGYMAQLGIVGAVTLAHRTFEGLGVVSISISVLVTLAGLKILRNSFDCNMEHYMLIYRQFVRIMATFVVFMLILWAYIIANTNTDGSGQGFYTVALAIITFIFKKVFLAMTDPYPIEIAMVISGLWLENLVDVFITLAYPTARGSVVTLVIIWLSRIAEDVAYLGFQLDIWFKFRVWIKGKFKKEQQGAIEEDVDKDDRGHSNIHPGYRRRQMRFLIWKLISQLSSNITFVILMPALRFGQNKEFYPYSENEFTVRFQDVRHDEAYDCFTEEDFKGTVWFAMLAMLTFFISGSAILVFMNRYHKAVLQDLVDRYNLLIVQDTYFGFVVSVLISNVVLAVSSVQYYNRVYYF
ncbi:unnamed protein product [Ostreobium quekettii]|uniref:Transmembrane protein n=1 Tax=Ostreobium quekettii TaxID=121088 RepID=A0A8S1IZ94_9CHLO|nr:unnamed protein product [Ostreobium quekettii]|eukprot:evm.model.scf_250.9 EVM.evm.TU.scf_250.9   scf_250:84470-86693(-)